MRKNDTFDQFISNVYLPYIRLRKRSWKVDERYARLYVSAIFGHKKLSEITQPDIEEWLARMRTKYSPATCNRALAVLEAVLNAAVERGILEQSPARKIHPFKDANRRERYLTKDEGLRLVKKLETDTSPHAKALHLLLLTGARKSEIIRAKWEYIDNQAQTLLVPLSKSGKTRK